jgi:hypothetical protein
LVAILRWRNEGVSTDGFQRREQQRWILNAVSSPNPFPILYDLFGNHNIRSNFLGGGGGHSLVGEFKCKIYQHHYCKIYQHH